MGGVQVWTLASHRATAFLLANCSHFLSVCDMRVSHLFGRDQTLLRHESSFSNPRLTMLLYSCKSHSHGEDAQRKNASTGPAKHCLICIVVEILQENKKQKLRLSPIIYYQILLPSLTMFCSCTMLILSDTNLSFMHLLCTEKLRSLYTNLSVLFPHIT